MTLMYYGFVIENVFLRYSLPKIDEIQTSAEIKEELDYHFGLLEDFANGVIFSINKFLSLPILTILKITLWKVKCFISWYLLKGKIYLILFDVFNCKVEPEM